MDDTPVEHVDAVAVAVNCTGEVTVAPFVGLVTVTVARAGTAKDTSSRMTYRRIFMAGLPQMDLSMPAFQKLGEGGKLGVVAVKDCR
jgi:hypothetical protein